MAISTQPHTVPSRAAAADARRRRVRWPHISTLLACLIYFYLVLPSLTVIPISFSKDFSLAASSFSLVLYRNLFASNEWTSAIAHSVTVAVLASALAVLAGIPAAYAFARGRFKGKSIAQLMVICPLFVPVIVIALGLYFLGAATGTLGTLAILVLAHTMYAMPFVVVMILSGLRQVDPSLERAGLIMGASSLRVFLQIVLPQLYIAIFAGWLFAFLVSFDEIVIAWFVSGPKTVTLPVRMYSSIMWDNTPEIAAVSTLLTVFSFVICMAVVWLGASPLHPSGPAHRDPARRASGASR